MEDLVKKQAYELITSIPAVEEELHNEIARHYAIYTENKGGSGYDEQKRELIAYANVNQLLQREISEDPLKEARELLGKTAINGQTV